MKQQASRQTPATAGPAGPLIGQLLIDVSLGSVPGGQGCDHLEQVGGARRSALDRADLNLDLALLDVVDRLVELDDSAVKAPANDGPAFHGSMVAGRGLGGHRVCGASPSSDRPLKALPRAPASFG